MLPPDRHADIDAIARDLERYVEEHPAAVDTVAGIARWWLARPLTPPLEYVEAALDLLVDRGVLTRRGLPDGNSVYGRAPFPSNR